jgi:hypothetical protein
MHVCRWFICCKIWRQWEHHTTSYVLVSWYGISLSSRIHSGVFSNDMWQTIHFYLCQLSVLVLSDFMIILCQMFTHMWHTLPCCTLAIIDTAWEGTNGKLSKPLYAVGIYRKEIAAYWKKFRKKSYSYRNHIRFENKISLKCWKTSSTCTIQLSKCMKCNIIIMLLYLRYLASFQ